MFDLSVCIFKLVIILCNNSETKVGGGPHSTWEERRVLVFTKNSQYSYRQGQVLSKGPVKRSIASRRRQRSRQYLYRVALVYCLDHTLQCCHQASNIKSSKWQGGVENARAIWKA